MAKQKKSTERQADEKKQAKSKPGLAADLLRGQANLTNISDPIVAIEDSSIKAQAAQLSDSHLRPAQRQTLAAHIGQVQGNRHLRRVIASLTPNKSDNIQRDGPQGKTGVAEQAPSAEKEKFDLNKWLHGKIYDLLKEQLGEDKLKEHAKTLASTATEALMKQIRGATSETDFVQKAQAEQIGRLLTADIRKGAEALLKSPEGQKVRQYILDHTKEDPVFAVGMVLLGLGAMIAANAEIPELKKDFDLGAGFKIGGQAKLGKFQEIAIQQVQLSLNYSSKYFQAGVQGSYQGEGEQTGFGTQANAAVGSEEFKFTTKATLDPDGNLKLDVGPALNLKDRVAASAGATWSSAAGWSGVGKLRLGDKNSFLTSQVQIGADGEIKMAHGVGLHNPFDLQNLRIDASLHHTLTDPKITGANLAAQYDILQDEAAGRYLFLRFEGAYQPPGQDSQPENVSGVILLGGRF